MARFEGEPVEQEKKPRFGGDAPAPASEPEDKPLTPMQRVGKVAESALGGAALGAVAPEATQLVGKGMQLYAPTRIPGMMVERAGVGMKAARGAEIGSGAIGGMTSEIAGQQAQVRGASPPIVFAAELAGGMVGPEFIKTVTNAVKYGARKLLGIEPVSAVKTVAEDLGLNEKALSPSQRDFIKKQIEDLRGAPAGGTKQETIYDVLKTGATDITKEAERKAAEARRVGTEAMTEAERRAEKMRLAGKKTTSIGEKASEEARAARATIGQEREASEIGNDLRTKINESFGSLTEARSKQYDAQKKIRDDIVRQKESSGQLVKSMPEYKKLVDDLKNKLLIGKVAQEQTTAPVTEKGVLQAYQNIYDAVTDRRVVMGIDQFGNPNYKTFPTSFEALDDVRRRLGDVAFGKEVEGYSAIGSNIAKKYYAEISDLQSKFAGEAHDALQGGYEMASRLLDKYKSAAGKKATAADRFDPTRYKTDAASLPNDYFSSKQSVKDLIELTNGDVGLVTKAASDFTARQLKDMNSKQVSNWLNKNTDWLTTPELKPVKDKVEAYIKTLERGERISGKTGEAAKILEAREPKVLREGERAVTTAEKQAADITGEAADRVKTILGDKNPAARVREIILSGKPSVWNEVGPILAGSPEGKNAVADAVRQIMADRAEGGLVSSVRIFREDVAPSLKAAGLMTDSQLSSLQAQLQAIANSAVGEEAKLSFAQRAIKNAITGVASTPVGGAAYSAGQGVYNFLSPQTSSDVINKRGSIGSVAPRF
jgi:hypothetical protein